MCAGLVTDFEEKPSSERLAQLEGVSKNASGEDPFEASMGIYMFKREVLEKLLDRHSAGNNSKPDAHFGYDVIPACPGGRPPHRGAQSPRLLEGERQIGRDGDRPLNASLIWSNSQDSRIHMRASARRGWWV